MSLRDTQEGVRAESSSGESDIQKVELDPRHRFAGAKARCEKSLNSMLGHVNKTSWLYRLSRSPIFAACGMCMTVLNCVVVAVDADLSIGTALRHAITGERLDETIGPSLAPFHLTFLGWLTLEVFINIAGFRIGFFTGPDHVWNLLDLIILFFSVLSLLSMNLEATYLRILRVARVARSFQAVRLLRLSDNLQRMLAGVASVAMTLIWTALLLFIVTFVFGIAMMEGITAHLSEDGPVGSGPTAWAQPQSLAAGGGDSSGVLLSLQSYYGGIFRTVATLFRAVSGSDWSAFVAPIARLSGFWGLVWMGYIFVALFGVLNMLTGIVVNTLRRPLPLDASMNFAAQLSEERHLETLVRQQMAKFGKDGEHERLRRKMFERIVRSESVSDYLQRFGIHVSRLEDVFGLMDWERQGSLSADVVARRLLSLRGEAKSADLRRLAFDISSLRGGLRQLQLAIKVINEKVTAPSSEEDEGSER